VGISLRSNASTTGTAASATLLPMGWGSTQPQAGDLAIMWVFTKPFSVTPTTPAGGWFLISGPTTTGSTATTAADNGSIAANCYGRFCTGTETTGTSFNVTITGGNSSAGGLSIYAKDDGEMWDFSTWTTGLDLSSGTNFSATGGAFEATRGDWILGAGGSNTDLGTSSASAGSMSGLTVSNNARKNVAITTGNDLRFMQAEASVTAGSATTGPVLSWTNASVQAEGIAHFLRLRVLPYEIHQPTPRYY